MKQADIDENARRVNVEINQAHVATGEKLAELLGQIRTSSEFRMPGSWLAFVVVPEHDDPHTQVRLKGGADLYWCIAAEHDYAQAALLKAVQSGHVAPEKVGRFLVQCVRCKPEIVA